MLQKLRILGISQMAEPILISVGPKSCEVEDRNPAVQNCSLQAGIATYILAH
jgi:hypothetical protein